MNYQLTIAIKQRKCSMCSAKITKGTKLFVMSDWPRDADFSIKKNICLDCAPKLTDPEFVVYLRNLLKELEHLETLQQTAIIKPDLSAVYVCEVCQGQVKYDIHFERYQCQFLDCQQLYEMEEVKLLRNYHE
mgnify:CR=1 FL=1